VRTSACAWRLLYPVFGNATPGWVLLNAATGTIVDAVCNDGAGGATRIITATAAACAGDANIVGYVAENTTARFVQAGTGALANAGRNIINTPGLNIWNMSIFKSTKLTERFSLQFRVDTYNTFNHRNFSIGLPSNNGALDQTTNPNPFSAAYVNVDSGSQFLNSRLFNGGSRTMQLGLKLLW